MVSAWEVILIIVEGYEVEEPLVLLKKDDNERFKWTDEGGYVLLVEVVSSDRPARQLAPSR